MLSQLLMELFQTLVQQTPGITGVGRSLDSAGQSEQLIYISNLRASYK